MTFPRTRHLSLFTLIPVALLALPLVTLTASETRAQAHVDSGDATVRNQLCVGGACPDDPTGTFISGLAGSVRIHANVTRLDFDDASTASLAPKNDWALIANGDPFSIDAFFSIADVTGGTTPFRIDAGAPENAIYLASSGQFGLGTSLPQADLHVVSEVDPSIMLQQAAGGKPPQRWRIRGNEFGLSLGDVDASTTPFFVATNAPTSAFHVNAAGAVGLGTNAPQELLHIRSNATNTDAFALFDANGAGSDSAFRLRQNGITPSTWEFRNQQDSGRLNVGLAGGNTPFKIDNAANNNLLRLGRNGQPGEVNITGTLVVNNTQLNVPDYVFSDDYALRSLAEVQAFIDENSHLPDVPSEAEIKANGVDMTAMQMTLLKKVEELTLYTLEQEAKLARMAELEAKIARLEALLD
ncbi:hypothetical protein A8B82_12065 [Sulfitobacter sp. EhC04]|uniref:hypothetical protein n=1 Tax=Sulfitobacter sp. EhC04 TaxID=1849168 RepID=UPI0007F3ADB3|nr:hypothetical protein [Sulfitobacter sp. EhC04]OAN77644.1 hypothetical protein A8B82_12065 [Sulfitobacter sp. EhC04]